MGDTLQLLWEHDPASDRAVRSAPLPPELAERYGPELAFSLVPHRPTVVANFVATLDGIVALGPGALAGGGLISGRHEPDRFVMGLLRAAADAVVVGAGTLRGSASHQWTPAHVHPRSEEAYRRWRAALGLTQPQPTTIIVTASGDIPTRHRGLDDPGIPVVVVTTAGGGERLRGADVAPHVRVAVVTEHDRLRPEDLIATAHRLGLRLLVCEGGPHLLGELVAADLVDELFLTVAPQLVGRAGPGRLGLLEGIGLGPEEARWARLGSVRRSGDHLFLRYTLRASATTPSHGGRP